MGSRPPPKAVSDPMPAPKFKYRYLHETVGKVIATVLPDLIFYMGGARVELLLEFGSNLLTTGTDTGYQVIRRVNAPALSVLCYRYWDTPNIH